MNLINLVDDDHSILESLQSILEKNGYKVQTANTPELFLKQVEAKEPAVAIIDLFYGGLQPDGEKLITILNEKAPLTQCLIMSGESDVKKTLSCLKKGALDFLEKPISLPRLLTSVRNAFSLFNSKESALSRHKILGETDIMKQVIGRIKKLATLNESVLIRGESGTGKELVAENLHLFSERYTLPFYKVNCTALNANLIESELFGHKAGSFTGADKDKTGFFKAADKSSLFIDEIGDFDQNLQSKILRTLQEKKITPVGSTKEIDVNTRLIFATHHPLEKRIEENQFREDLFYRISTFTIDLPPLRDRINDVNMIAQHFLDEFLFENNLPYKAFSEEAIDKLKSYTYPGNIRELSKIVKNVAFFSDQEIIGPDDIQFNLSGNQADIWNQVKDMNITEAKNHFEKQFLIRRLKAYNNDIQKTAESLEIIKNNLYRKLKQHNIQK
jgi:two-component system nitrogen regulation response regulator NtrX